MDQEIGGSGKVWPAVTHLADLQWWPPLLLGLLAHIGLLDADGLSRLAVCLFLIPCSRVRLGNLIVAYLFRKIYLLLRNLKGHFSQKPNTGSYFESDETTPHRQALFYYTF